MVPIFFSRYSFKLRIKVFYPFSLRWFSQCSPISTINISKAFTPILLMKYNPFSVLPIIVLIFGTQCMIAKKPNVLFILVDDMGAKDLSNEGSTFYESPNIDRIAREGMKFTRGYATCQVCSPSRASILTGKYPVNHGITTWIGDASGAAWSRRAGVQLAWPWGVSGATREHGRIEDTARCAHQWQWVVRRSGSPWCAVSSLSCMESSRVL